MIFYARAYVDVEAEETMMHVLDWKSYSNYDFANWEGAVRLEVASLLFEMDLMIEIVGFSDYSMDELRSLFYFA